MKQLELRRDTYEKILTTRVQTNVNVSKFKFCQVQKLNGINF